MCVPCDRPLRLIKWGVRSLYVLLFLSCMVVMGRWEQPLSIAFLGSVFALILPVIFTINDADLEELRLEQQVHTCTLGNMKR